MLQKISLKIWVALVVGIITGAILSPIISHEISHLLESSTFAEESKAYHIHADFLISVDGKEIDLSPNDFMSVAERILHPHVHLHDNNGKVIHFHAPDVTLKEFLSSLHIDLSQNCLSIDGNESCSSEDKVLNLFVNGTELSDKLESYVPSDEDKILLYYGIANNPELNSYLDKITDDACFYSGTCPERGIAPSESCGLTCEL